MILIFRGKFGICKGWHTVLADLVGSQPYPPGEPEGYSHGLQFAVHFINVLGNCFSRIADYFFVLTIRFGLAWSGEPKNKHSER